MTGNDDKFRNGFPVIRLSLDMNLQPILENDLVRVRPLRPEDFDMLFQVAKDPLIWEQHPAYDRYKKAVFSILFNESIASLGALGVEEKSTNQIIGSSRYKRLDTSDRAIEIGWSFLSRDKWGGQYNKSFKGLMIDHALRQVDHVVFYVGVDNIRSQRAVEKLGGVLIEGENLMYLARQDKNTLSYVISNAQYLSNCQSE